jgi:NADH-quinone oxidoreductase subunit C
MEEDEAGKETEAEGPSPQSEEPSDPAPATAEGQEKESESPGEKKPEAEGEEAKPAPKTAVKPEEKKEEPAPKTSNEDVEDLLGRLGGKAEHVEDIKPSIPAVRIPADSLVPACTYLRDELGYDHLACLTAIDWKENLEVVYNLWSYAKNRPIALRVSLTTDDPQVPSVTHVWKGADWLEREEYDLMGIHFVGHPDLRRIMLPEGWQGHPLRKDYDWKHEQYVGMDEEGNDVVYQEAREDAW